MVNIRDIAQESQHSVSTVSRVLNHSGYVSEKTRAEIEAVIKAANYVPSAMGQTLSRGKNQIIGVVIPSNQSLYFTQILSSIVQAAADRSTHILLLTSSYQPKREQHFLEMLRRHAVDALIFLSHQISTQTIQQYQQYGQIVLGEDPKESGLSAAFAQRGPSEVQALQWIAATYHPQHIGFFFHRGLKQSSTSRSWAQAYAQVFHQPVAPAQIVLNVDSFNSAYLAMASFTVWPDFLVANSDETAAGALQYCRKSGRYLAGVLGQEREPIGEVLGLATIDHHFDQLGACLFNLALSSQQQVTAIPATLISQR